MTFRQISRCLPAWLTAEIGKGAGTGEGAGQVNEEVVPTSSGGESAPVNLANGKRLDTAVTSRSPSGAVSRRLALGGDRRREGTTSVAYRVKPTVNGPREFRVIEGGGGRRQEEGTSAAYAQARRGSLASNSLKLVGG